MKIELNQQIDLGTVQFGTTKEFDVPVKNLTAQKLSVQVVPRCGSCTKVVDNPQWVNSGDTIIIKLSFTPTRQGEQSKMVDIRVNGTNESTITFKANVI
jgi:hypothetical protein